MENRAPKSVDELFHAFRVSGAARQLATRYSSSPCLDANELEGLGSGTLSEPRARDVRWHLIYCDACFDRAVRAGHVARPESERP